MADMGEAFEKLGVGLSRLLRYSYGGFLFVGLLSLLNADVAKPARQAMGWELVALAAVVVGAGAYAVHRGVVVHGHHVLLCLWWLIADFVTRRPKAKSANPTRWLGSLCVPLLWRIPTYTLLRRGQLFKEYREDWNVAHAEAGLVLMMAEAFLLAWLYARGQTPPALNPDLLFWMSVVLFVFSFGGFSQHALECLHFRKKKAEIEAELRTLGLVRPEHWAGEHELRG